MQKHMANRIFEPGEAGGESRLELTKAMFHILQGRKLHNNCVLSVMSMYGVLHDQ